jgi:fimbrial isopeptide formation D2 family protein
VPADTTFVSLASPGGWTCTTPAVGATGAINCSNPGMIVGSAVFTLVVAVDANAGGGTILTNTATAASTTIDPNTGNESDTETTNVISPATLTATKAVTGGTRTPGGTVTYTVTINNAGPAMQGDDPGSNEMIDVLPSQLTLVSANASSGTAVANVGTNTVTWNGSIPAGGSVTITIQALVNVGVPVGTSISNQATINYDADGNGTNEATTSSDDTTQPGATNPTAFFVISAQANVAGVPALDGFGLAALAALLAAVGFMVARRS